MWTWRTARGSGVAELAILLPEECRGLARRNNLRLHCPTQRLGYRVGVKVCLNVLRVGPAGFRQTDHCGVPVDDLYEAEPFQFAAHEIRLLSIKIEINAE